MLFSSLPIWAFVFPLMIRTLPRDQKRTKEGKVPGQTRPVDRIGQSTEQDSQQNRREQGSRQNKAVGRREQALGPVDLELGLANVRGWVSVPGGFLGISLEYTLALAHRYTESYVKVSQTSPFLRLELTQVRVCLFSFLPPSRLCMLCFVCP